MEICYSTDVGAQKLKPIPTHPHPNMVFFFFFLVYSSCFFPSSSESSFPASSYSSFSSSSFLFFCSSAEARLEVAEVADLVFSGEVQKMSVLEGGYHVYIYIYTYINMYIYAYTEIHAYTRSPGPQRLEAAGRRRPAGRGNGVAQGLCLGDCALAGYLFWIRFMSKTFLGVFGAQGIKREAQQAS